MKNYNKNTIKNYFHKAELDNKLKLGDGTYNESEITKIENI